MDLGDRARPKQSSLGLPLPHPHFPVHPDHRLPCSDRYNTWPDHGVPRQNGEFFCDNVLAMLQDVREAAAKPAWKGSPVLVHCSAGVGRTGTFIVIDWALRMMARDGKFNVQDTIRRLRQDRVSIVQTVDQYEFVHAAVRRHAELQGKTIRVADSGGNSSSPQASGVSPFRPAMRANPGK